MARVWLAITFLTVVSATVPFANSQQPDGPPTAFEVASVKRSVSNARGSMVSGPAPSQFTTVNASLDRVIAYAYGVFDDRLSGLPHLATTERYDIVGKYPKGLQLDPALVPRMVQTLLAERFALRARRERREGPVYHLLVAR
jgi:uncharacterized protein (TIGR03435 family)